MIRSPNQQTKAIRLEAQTVPAARRWRWGCWIIGLFLGCLSPLRAVDSDLPGGRSFRPPPGRYGPFNTDPARGVPKHAYSPFDSSAHPPSAKPVAGQDYVPGRLVLKLKPSAASATPAIDGAPDLVALEKKFAAYGLSSLQRVFPKAQPPSSASKTLSAVVLPAKPDLTRWLRARCDPSLDLVELARALSGDSDLELAEPDYTRHLAGGGLPDAGTDPIYAQQWHLGAAHVPEAWAYLQGKGLEPGGSRDVVVAVIDTGIDYTHSDLAANLWTNSREIPGNNKDDDGNGFVDDVFGVRVEGYHSGNPMDDHGHGTHVAGIVAARAGNGLGGVGVAYNVRLMAIKAGQSSGLLAASDIAEGVHYAVANGADVINMSFGGYFQSTVEEEALAIAYGQCVLVAAAGNDRRPNEGIEGSDQCDPILAKAAYPAAYNWVLGVMATAPGGALAPFSNFDCVPRNTIEYELRAPGSKIWSTVPGNQYAAWDGTSMAAPIVSGIAALARTQWRDKEQYPSRFIMGQIASTPGANALFALTNSPRPALSYVQHWIFDAADLATVNDQDGRGDAGETIDLAVVIRNQWGKASDVRVTLDALGPSQPEPDPYVTWLNSTVDYGAIGAFNSDDNGLVYSNQTIIGVQNPFRLLIAPGCPNDHVIPIRVRTTCRNGMEASDATTYSSEDWLNIIVQRGRELPRFITNDLTLTKSDYWIVGDQTLIPTGITVTVTEGTQLQFYSPRANDPYAHSNAPLLQVEGKLLIRGSAQAPVEIFTDAAHEAYPVSILQWAQSGDVRISYARVQNPNLGTAGSGFEPITLLDHCLFAVTTSAATTPTAAAKKTCCSLFQGLGNGLKGNSYYNNTAFNIYNDIFTNLYDNCILYLTSTNGTGNVFLRNCRPDKNGYLVGSVAKPAGTGDDPRLTLLTVNPTNGPGGSAYVVVSRSTSSLVAERFARSLGGDLVAIHDRDENNLVRDYLAGVSAGGVTAFETRYPDLIGLIEEFNTSSCLIGLSDRDVEGRFVWSSGEPVTFSNWVSGYPHNTAGDEDYVSLSTSAGGPWMNSSYSYSPKVLELPGQWTREQLLGARQSFMEQMNFCLFTNNAILNAWWTAQPTNWLQFLGSTGRDTSRYVPKNYWGTTSRTLVDATIVDFNDDFNLQRYVYEPVLEDAPEWAYPFVVGVRLDAAGRVDVTTVGAEPVTFTVTFNRNMDTNVTPLVSFGPDTPLTDYTVYPLEGGWRDARTWIGTFRITPGTGDGYHLIRVARAVAADDPWLVIGNDAGRFRFQIRTATTAAMNLQAFGGAGRVDLSWSQDEFELLAGYNLYRSTNANYRFTRLNGTLIPPQVKTFADTNVVASRTYFYKFGVVKSDMTESNFSNVAQAAALDTLPPVLSHTNIASAPAGLPLTFLADVTDNVGVQKVTLDFRSLGASAFTIRPMTWIASNRYAATIEGPLVAPPGLEYYLEASDGVSTVRSASPLLPQVVWVQDRPVVSSITPARGAAGGGDWVTVSGANYRSNATVSLGGMAASDVTWVNASQILCRVPPHYPALVDVAVVNPDGQVGTLLRGFTYESSLAFAALPLTGGGKGDSVLVPLSVGGLQGLVAADITVTFGSSVLRARGAQTGTLTAGWTLMANTNTLGQIRLSLAGAGGPVSGDGTLALLELEVIGSSGTNSPLRLASLTLNDGAIAVSTTDGSFTVAPTYRISGAVTYWRSNAPVSGVVQTLTGERVFSAVSGTNGAYTTPGVSGGTYVLTPAKSDEVNGISAFDASLVLQHAAGLTMLTGAAATAADVNRSGSITSMDAFLILQHVVGLQALPFPGAGAVWVFSPTNRSFSSLSSNMTNQDFTAILLGDVSGNWAAAPAGAKSLTAMGSSAILGWRKLRVRSGELQVWVLLRAPGSPVHSVDLSLAGNPPLGLKMARSEALAKTWLLACNTNQSGVARLALAGATPVQGIGALLVLTLPEEGGKDLALADAALDETDVTAAFDLTGPTFDDDSDGDGQSDWQEIRAGTDPTDPQSRFGIASVEVNADGSRTVRWWTVPDKTYQLWGCDPMGPGGWQTVGSEVYASNGVEAVTDSSEAGSGRLYRVQLIE